MRCNILIYGFLIILVLDVAGQHQVIPLSREKNLEILHELDTFLMNYSRFSSLNDAFLTAEASSIPLLKLFADSEVLVFDDINTHMPEGREDMIIEKRKSIMKYILDIRANYETLNCRIVWTDAGDATSRLYREDGKYFIPLRIRKDLRGYTASKVQYYIHTNPELYMLIGFPDTMDIDIRIYSLDKTSTETPDWECNPPELSKKLVETIFSASPGISYLYSEQFGTDTEILRMTTIQLPLYGVSGGINWKFVLARGSRRTHGLSTGLWGGWHYTGYFQDYYLTVNEDPNIKDKDNESYFPITEASSIDERLNFVQAGIPLYYHLETWKKNKPRKGRYFQLGGRVSYMFPIKFSQAKNWDGDPNLLTRTNMGYYPDLNVTLSGIPEYGFTTETFRPEEGTYHNDPFSYSVNMGFGRIKRTKKMGTVFYFGLDMSVHLNNLAQGSGGGRLFGETGHEYNGILTELKDARLTYVGIYLGIRGANKNDIHLMEKKVLRLSPLEQ